MNYYCVVYRSSDTYRRNFSTYSEAADFADLVGGNVYSCDRFGNIVGEV